MTNNSELIERLRNEPAMTGLQDEAADALEAADKRVSELEAALKMARDALDDCAASYLHADSVLTDEAIAKINEVLK